MSGFEPVDMGDPDLNREINMMLAEADTSPPVWWWLSFADPSLPKGSHFLGAALVHAPNVGMAIKRAWQLGINPGGQVASWGPIPEEVIPPDHPREVLLSRDDIEAHGGGTSLGEMDESPPQPRRRRFRKGPA